MKAMLLTGFGLVLLLGLAVTVGTVSAEAEDAVTTETAEPACDAEDPQGDQVGPRDGTRGENAPRDGRGARRRENRGEGRGEGEGARDGSGARRGLGHGEGRGEGEGPRDGSGRGRGQARGGGARQGPRDGSGPDCR